jgi:Tfp pilus assembly protein PilF
LERAPDYLPARLSLAEAELAAGRWEEAERQLAAALSRDPRSAAGHQLRGQLAVLRGDFGAAARDYEAALALEPWASSLHAPLAAAYARLGDRARAEAHLARRGDRRVSLPDPWMREVRAIATGVRAHLLRGAQAMRAGNLTVAIDEFGRAAAADPADPSARLNLGAALAQAGRLDEAKLELEAAVALDLDAASRSKVCFNLGMLALQRGRRDEAIERLRQALDWDPRNEPARRQLSALSPVP